MTDKTFLLLKPLFSSLLLLLALPLFSQNEKAVIDKVVATVGGEIILLSEIEEQYAYLTSKQGGIPPDARCSILEQLMAQKLLVNQAKLDSVEITDEEVDRQLDARVDRIFDLMQGDLKQFEEYYSQSPTEMKEQMRDDMKGQMLAERMRAKIFETSSVTPSEVKDFFQKIPKDSLPYFNSEVEIREILFKPKVNTEEKQKAYVQISNLRKRIVDEGADFEELAKKHSDDPGSAAQNGDLGWQKRGTLVPEFEAAAYKLEKGQISPVVESDFGYHVIQMIERRGNNIHTRHILIKPDITDADLAKAQKLLDSIRIEILRDSLSFSAAVKTFGDKNTQSFHNDGRLTNPNSGTTYWEIGDLEPDIYFAIDTLKVNRITAPIEFREPDGARGYRLIQLQSRTTPHKANLLQDYSKIQTAALEQKKSFFINEWVEQKVRSTFISVEDNYKACPNIRQWVSSKVD